MPFKPTTLTLMMGGTCLVIASSFTAADEVGGDDWVLPAEHLHDNGVRGKVVLNAWWARHKPEEDGVDRVAIPGTSRTSEARVLTRQFDLPDGWRDRRLVIEVSNLVSAGPMELNGRKLADVPGGLFHTFDIPDDMLVDGSQTLSIRTEGVRGDVWLYSYPRSTATVEESYLTTSVRHNRVNVDISGTASPGAQVRPIVRIYEDEELTQLVKQMAPPQRVVADDRGRWRASVAEPWTDPKLWSHWDPNVYFYTVELLDDRGERADLLLPRLFGFREVWVEGRQFMLNGVPLHFTGDTWAGIATRQWNTRRDQAEAAVRHLKAAGIHAGHRLESDVMLDIAAREGVLVTWAYVFGLDIPLTMGPAVQIGVDAGDAGGDGDLLMSEDEAGQLQRSMERARRIIHRWRENPAILSWSIRSPWTRVTMHPTLQGHVDDPWNYWPGNDDPQRNRLRYEVADRTVEFVRSLDPHRPVGAQNQPSAEIEWSTRYLCIDLDTQERAQFFYRWKQGPGQRVLWPSEYDLAPFHGHHFLRTQPLQMPQGTAHPSIYLENAARLIGDDVFLEPTDDQLKQWHRWWYDRFRNMPGYQAMMEIELRDVARGWRTSGISGQAHWVLREGFPRHVDQRKRNVQDRYGIEAQADPRQPGFSLAFDRDRPSTFPVPGVDQPLAGGEAYLQAISPLMAYIGGGEGNPYSKDHLFHAGDTVQKAVVVLNDYFESVHVEGEWTLTDASGGIVKGGPLSLTVGPGTRAINELPITFDAPSVRERSDFTIRIELSAGKPGHLEDSFDITVFPTRRTDRMQLQRRVWFAPGPGDEINSLISALRIRGGARELPGMPAFRSGEAGEDDMPRPGDLLIIPRRFFSDESRDLEFENLRLLEHIGFDDLVERGLRVLVMEQDVDNLLGINTEYVRPRRAFKAAPGHPVFAGLEAGDLMNWTGRSNLDRDREVTPITPSLLRFPDRLWKVTTQNAVATRTLVRPQTGAVRALAVSGFNLHESPLLEVNRGQGRMLLSMFDISNRYGIDPAATLLLDNMIRYLDAAPDPDPRRGEVRHVAANRPGVEARAEVFRAERPAGEQGWGITRGELFFRDSVYENNAVTRHLPEVKVPVFTASAAGELPQVIRLNPRDGVFEITLDDASLPSGWARTKAALIRTALVVNQGGSRLDGPAVGLHGNRARLYPHRWVEGFVHPYTAACW